MSGDENCLRLLEQYDRLDTELGETLRYLRHKEDRLKLVENEKASLEKCVLHLELSKHETQLQTLMILQREYETHLKYLEKEARIGMLRRILRRRNPQEYTEAQAINRVVTAIRDGDLQFRSKTMKLDLTDKNAFRGLRSTTQVETETDGTSKIQVRETSTSGVHSVILRCLGARTHEIVSTQVNVFSEGINDCHVILRSATDLKNAIIASVDLRKGQGQIENLVPAKSKNSAIRVRKLLHGWVEIHLEGMLAADMSEAELEVSTAHDKQRKFEGNPERGFSLRRVSYTKTNWMERDEPTAAPEVAAEISQEHKALRSAARDAAKRAKLRRTYLASSEYARIARQRGQYSGRRAFIIGNGPSINGQNLVALKDEITFVTNWFVNHPQFREIQPNYICVSSHEMFGGWKSSNPQLNTDWYEKVTAVGTDVKKIFSYRFADMIKRTGLFPEEEVEYLLFDRPKEQVDIAQDIQVDLSRPMLDGYTGVLTFCLPLAHHFGISEIYLVGCDCDYGIKAETDERQYFYDRSQHTSSETKSSSIMRVWAEDGPGFQSYKVAKARFDADGIPIINLTAGGRLNVFPRANYARFIESLGLTKAGA